MTTTQTTPTRSGSNAVSLTNGHLAGWVPLAILGASFAVSAVIFGLIAGLSSEGFNYVGMVVIAAIFYLVTTWAISRAVEGSRQALNRFVTGIVVSAFMLAILPLVSLIVTLVIEGLPALNLDFFTNTQNPVLQGEHTGALQAIVGTLIVTLIATLISVPVGVFTSIYLVEYGQGWLKRSIGFFVDVMTGVPSIVAGLFAFALFYAIIEATQASYSGVITGFTGAVALSVLMIPTVVRSTEEMLRLVPSELREASYALGVPKWRTIVKVVLPTALPGIITGVMLAIARVIGETAPLLIAAGFQYYLNTNPFNGPMTSLPVYVFTQNADGQAENVAQAWTGALVLLFIVMLLNIVARVVAHIFAPKQGR